MNSHNNKAQPSSGEPHTISIAIKELDKKGYAMLNGQPCKIKTTGVGYFTKGCKKTYIIGSNIWTNKEQTEYFRMYSEVEVPIAKKIDYYLVGIENNFASLMDEKGDLREELRLPSWEERGDLTEKIINAFEANQNVLVTVLEACGQAMILDLKEDL